MKTYKESVVLPPRIFNYEPKIHGFNLYKKTGSRAEGSKDVIIFPKFFSSQIASEELKVKNDPKVENEVVLSEADAIMADKENVEQPPVQEPVVEEIQKDDEQIHNQNQGNKKNKKKNKKNKNKGKN